LGEKQEAPQEELGYEHGEYPFVELARERIGRAFMESRGVPEIVATWQEEAKVQRDAAVDRTSIEIVPPLKVPTRDLGKQIRLRPAGQIGQDHAGTVEWMQPPAGNLQASAMVLQEVNREVAEYFGKPAELVAPALAQIAQQLAVDRWLESWKAVFRQVDALMRQFLSDEEWERISGESAAERALAESAAEYDWSMDFDVTRLDAETLTARLKAFMDFALAADAAGVIDRAKFTALVATAIDPSIASAVLQDAGQASQQLFRQVREQLGMMALGNPPELTPDADPAAAAKLRFTEDVMNQNPKYQAALKQDPVFQEQFGKWMKSLQFNVAQASNRMVGRFGA